MSGAMKLEITYLEGERTENVYPSVADRVAAVKFAEKSLPMPDKPDLSDEFLRELNLEEYREAKTQVETERVMAILYHAAYLAAKRQQLPNTETYDKFINAIALEDNSPDAGEDGSAKPADVGESAGPSSES